MNKDQYVVICPKCGMAYYAAQEVECPNCHVKMTWTGVTKDKWTAMSVEQRTLLKNNAMGVQSSPEINGYANILTTTGFNFEGYRITAYLGIITGESVLGTGFLSSFNAGWSDIFGTHSQKYQEKLKKAKDDALILLRKEADDVGANAVIGVDLDYNTFSADIIGVIASGTAVRIEPITIE